MQSLHYNSGSIKLTRERCTMVTRWEANEVARWIGGTDHIEFVEILTLLLFFCNLLRSRRYSKWYK